MALAGAAFNTKAMKWQARITRDGVRKHLGYFDTEQGAHEAFLEAKGESPEKPKGPKPNVTPKADPTDYASLRDMFGREFMGCFDSCFDNPQWQRVLTSQLMRIAKALNVYPYYVSQVMFWGKDAEFDMDTDFVLDDATIIARVETLRALDLWDQVDDIVHAMEKGGQTFEQAVSRYCDLV